MNTRRMAFAVLIGVTAVGGASAPQTESAPQSPWMIPLSLSSPELRVSADALAHMIGGVGAPAAPLDVVRVEWRDGVIELPHGARAPISLELEFRPGAGLPLDDSTHLVILEDLAGELTVTYDGRESAWHVEPGNYGVFFAKSQYNPASPELPLGLHLPVLLRSAATKASIGAHLILGFRYDARSKLLSWNKGSIARLSGSSPAARKSSIDALVAALTAPAESASSAAAAESAEPHRPLRVRANHATTNARFKYGDGLAHLIRAEPDALPGCTDDPDRLEVEFLGTTDDDRLATVRLELMPGASWTAGAGVKNQLLGLSGFVRIGEGASVKDWVISNENRGSSVADSLYDPRTRQLTFHLPVALEDSVSEPLFGDVELRCAFPADALICDEILVDELARTD